jgi:hypothetical protein
MIRRILLLKFVSWVVLSPVLALAPTLHIRFSGVPHPSHPLRTWELGTPQATGLVGFRMGCYALSSLSPPTLAENARMGQPLRWRGGE